MPIRAYSYEVKTAGVAGSATGSTEVGVPPGRLVAVHVDYQAGAPATTDLTVANLGVTLVEHANSGADRMIQLGGGTSTVVNGAMTVSVAQSDALSPAARGALYVEV